MRAAFLIACVAVACAANVRTAPLPVSLGQIMEKIETGAPIPEIIQMVEDLEQKIQDEERLAAATHEAFQRDDCDTTTKQQGIATADQLNATLTSQMAALMSTNAGIKAGMPAEDAIIEEKQQLIAELRTNVTALRTEHEEKVADYERHKSEITAALGVVREIHDFIQNSTLDNDVWTRSFLQGKTDKAADERIAKHLSSMASNAKGIRRRLMESASKAMAHGGMTDINELLYRMSEEYEQDLAQESVNENNRVLFYYTSLDVEIGRIAEAEAAIGDAKIRQAEAMGDFAANTVTLADLSGQRSEAIGARMIAAIEVADTVKRCIQEESEWQRDTERRAVELSNVRELLAKLREVDVPEHIADHIADISAAIPSLSATTPPTAALPTEATPTEATGSPGTSAPAPGTAAPGSQAPGTPSP